jgi:monothiol glutaredoxin
MAFSRDEIQKIIDSEKVVIFGKGEKHEPRCGFTMNVQNIFDDVYPDYKMVNVLGNRELREEMKTFSDWPTFPQIYVNGEFIGGGDIAQEMYEGGEFERTLK